MRCVHHIFACTANLNRTIPTGLDKTLAHKCKLDESLNDFAKVSRNSAAKTLPTLGIVYRISCAIHQETRLTSKLSVMEDTTDCPLNWWLLHGASNLLEILAEGTNTYPRYVGEIVSMISGEVAEPDDVDILRTSESPPREGGLGGCGCVIVVAGCPSSEGAEVAPNLQLSSM